MKIYQQASQSDIYASRFIGMRIYSDEKDYDSIDMNSSIEPGTEKELKAQPEYKGEP